MKRRFGVFEAIKAINKFAEFGVEDDDYNKLNWYDDPKVVPIPTREEVEAKIAELEAEYAAQEYARKRVEEYPPITEYLDGVVKGDQAQIDAYIAACQAVKAKYPKPE